MNNKKSTCLTLTPDDILNLRGQPVTKRINHYKNSSPDSEEWIYYQVNTNTKEYYLFKNGQLITWTKKNALE
jgi:hypothetical protein